MSHGSDLLSFEVLRSKGGLIQAYKLNGTSVVFNRPLPDQLDGSIFWPSPQSDWGWPPPPQIDPVPSKDFQEEYSAEVNQSQGRLTLTSPIAPKLGIRVRKSFSARPQQGAVLLNYEILNTGTGARSFAPWEITRVASGGLTFFAAADGPPTSGTFPPLQVENAAGATWFQQHPTPKGGGKLFANAAKGWLAHVSGELILVKCFQPVHGVAMAPKEKQIEIYDGGDYVEVELQGAYVSILPGGSLNWQVMWFLRRLPVGMKDQQALAIFAGSLCYNALPADSGVIVQ